MTDLCNNNPIIQSVVCPAEQAPYHSAAIPLAYYTAILLRLWLPWDVPKQRINFILLIISAPPAPAAAPTVPAAATPTIGVSGVSGGCVRLRREHLGCV